MKPQVLETSIKFLGTIDPSLVKSAKNAQNALKGIDLKAIGTKVAIGAMALVAVKATADMGKALYGLGKDFDKAFDTIRIGTGATGEQLEGLKQTFKDVYGSVPNSMEESSKAVTEYNTRLGLTGTQLKGLSEQALLASSMLHEDLGATLQNSSQMFQAWNINAKDMGGSMDYVFRVSQATGIGMNQLMGGMKSLAPAMQQLGLSFNESAAMMGQMEKAGVNTDEALKAMKKSVSVFAKEGLDATKGFEVYSKAIRNAKTDTEAISLASEVFGARAGSTMANAIRKGTLSVEEFQKAMENSGESIQKAMWDTADAEEKMQILQHSFQSAIEPLASGVFDAINDIMPDLLDMFSEMKPYIEDMSATLLPVIKSLIGVVTDLIPPIADIAVALLPPLAELLQTLSPIISLIAQAISVALVSAIQTAVPVIQSLMGIISNLIGFVRNVFTGQWSEAWQNIVNIVKNLFKGLGNILLAPFKVVTNAVDNIKSKIGGGGDKSGDKAPQNLPKYAKGGFTNGLSLAGEAGTEAIISFNPAYRSDNISTWLKAGEMLGLSSATGSNAFSIGGITFSPNLYFTQKMSDEDVMSAVKRAGSEFGDLIQEKMQELSMNSYAPVTMQY